MNPNDPAYPTISAGVHLPHHGMTTREVMAMHLMSAAMARPGIRGSFAEFAQGACRAADALIAELNRTKQP